MTVYKLAAPTLVESDTLEVTVDWEATEKQVVYSKRAKGTQTKCPERLSYTSTAGGTSHRLIDSYDLKWRYQTQASEDEWLDGGTATISAETTAAVVSAPDGALRVQVAVKAVSNNYTDWTYTKSDGKYDWSSRSLNYFSAAWSAYTSLQFTQEPEEPEPVHVPDAPSISYSVNDGALSAQVTCTISDETVTAFLVEQQIDGTAGKDVRTAGTYTSYLTPGTRKRWRALAITAEGVKGPFSAWTDYANAVCACPSVESLGAASSSSVKVTIGTVARADHYQVRYAKTLAQIQGDDYQTKASTDSGAYIIVSGLEEATRYWFSVRAYNADGVASDWSAAKAVTTGSTPDAPTVGLTSYAVAVGASVNVWWTHNSTDGSDQTDANIQIQRRSWTADSWSDWKTVEDLEDADSYTFETTTAYRYRFRVQTAGATGTMSAWSGYQVLRVYSDPDACSYVSAISAGKFPFTATATFNDASGSQSPIGLTVFVTALSAGGADTPYGYKWFAAGEVVATKTMATKLTSKDVTFKVSDFADGFLDCGADCGISINATWALSSGLSGTCQGGTVAWPSVPEFGSIDADIVELNDYTVSVRPVCGDPKTVTSEGQVTEWTLSDCKLSVYRVNADGTLDAIRENMANDRKRTAFDAHPTLNSQTYRIVATDNGTGAQAWEDVSAEACRCNELVIMWDESWDDNETASIHRDDTYTGEILALPYNPSVQDAWKPDVELVEYSGRSDAVAYYGTQLGRTSSWSFDVLLDDSDTLSGIRRLAVCQQAAYFREPSGTGYWGHADVSTSLGTSKIGSCTLTITRTEA